MAHTDPNNLADEPSGGLPISSPEDTTKFYRQPFASMMQTVFRPHWELHRIWKEGDDVCFIGGPAAPPQDYPLTPTGSELLKTLEHRLETINEIACYVSEEDTSARYEGLVEIGKLARGEPSAWDRRAVKSGARVHETLPPR